MRIATICARGGSKGLPGKNTKTLLGEPLIAWSIAQAKSSGLFDCIVVSSDSAEIIEVADKYGAHLAVKRPARLASDESGKLPAIIHAVELVEEHEGEYDTIVDLDVTSPLRTPQDIIAAVRLQEESGCTNVITGTPAHRSPYFNLVEIKAGVAALSKPSSVQRRQDSPLCYDMNASIYVWNRNKFIADPKLFYPDTKLYSMPKERSIDIDDQLDFEVVEMIMRRRSLN
jgi:CMP-N,N'-diacetyllegionaminic acid synthase